MFQTLHVETQFILGTAITAGALGVAITIFALPQRARDHIAPFLLFLGTTSSICFILSAVLSTIQFFSKIRWIEDVSIILFCIGTITLFIPVIYIAYKLLRVRLLIRDLND